MLETDIFHFPVSATTRSPRPGEKHGRDYYFLSRVEFDAKICNREFLEHAEVYGHLYGTLKKTVTEALGRGELLLKDVDVQGARSIMSVIPPGDLKTVFIAPPSMEELIKRLSGRGSEDAEALGRRLAAAEGEMRAAAGFSRVIVNDDLDRAYAEFKDALMTR